MPRIPVTCIVCSEEVEEEKYNEHMKVAHGGKSQIDAIEEQKLREQNTPKVIPLNKEAPMPPEFEEVAQAIDKKPKEAPPVPTTPPPPPVEPKPLELKYRWEGSCPKCNTPIRTVVTKVIVMDTEFWYCTAFCLDHGEIMQLEVKPIPGQEKKLKLTKEEISKERELMGYPALKEKEVENGGGCSISQNVPVQAKMRSMRKVSKPHVPNK